MSRRAATLAAAAAAAALLAALAGCDVGRPGRIEVPADSAAGEIAFRLVGPGEAALVVPVYVNGEGPLDFILDTGATLTCVADSTAARLDLRERRVPGAIGVGVGGAGALRLATADSVRLGEVRAFDVPVCLVDLQQTALLGTPIDGLLGLNVLKDFVVTVDFPRRVLRLER